LLGFRKLRFFLGGRLRKLRFFLGRRLLGLLVDDALRELLALVREDEAREHEDHSGAARELREKIPRAAAPKHSRARATAENGADLRTLAPLQEHDHDENQAHHDMKHGQKDGHWGSSGPSKRTMREKLTGSRLAPPTSAPSMSCSAMRAYTLSGLTEPPYWMRIWAAAAPNVLPRRSRTKACTSCARAGVAVFPVPIAQTGS